MRTYVVFFSGSGSTTVKADMVMVGSREVCFWRKQCLVSTFERNEIRGWKEAE